MTQYRPIHHRTHRHRTHRGLGRPPFESISLLLQGGGALGAYQGGVYQALSEAELHPDWIGGISIGAINAAIIAGNPANDRVAKLREFWEMVSTNPFCPWGACPESWGLRGEQARGVINQISAAGALVSGVPGFFSPRFPPPAFQPSGTVEATSYYDTGMLRSSLEQLVDFDRINAQETRLSVGAVNVRSGNFVYFDTETHLIGPEHIMASGALPPGLPAIEIEGEHYWDGGLVSNTPLQWVLDSDEKRDTLAFQIDLWSARGEFPGTITDSVVRMKDIQYSSRTRASTDTFKERQRLRIALDRLLQVIPKDLQHTPEVELLKTVANQKVYSIVHLIYRAKSYEGHAKDYEFSRMTMEEHWAAGYHDAVRTLRHPKIFDRPSDSSGVATFDLAQDGKE